jgi:hypothetical protein
VTPPRSWIPANEPVVIAGHRIAGGLIYVGHSLRSPAGGVEPAQINPALPVDPPSPGRTVNDLGPAASYHLISSGHRAALLEWLARGRTDREVPVGLVTLFVSGLERRLLLDAAADPAVRAEFPEITAELHRLRELFGAVYPSFGQQVDPLLEALDLLTAAARWPAVAGPALPPPAATDDPRWPVPLGLRIALAQFANAARPLPPEWARAWAWYHPSLFPAAPQTRCPEEFTALFALRYRRRLPAGLVPAGDGRPGIRIGCQPVNPGMDTVVVERPDLPDVLAEPAATRQLGALIDEVTSALTPYSRWLARTPGGQDSIASTVLLPDDLLDHRPGPLRPLMTWADDRLAGSAHAVVDGAEFAPFWSSADPGRMSREEASSLALVLARIGLGVEPDVRFAGPPLGPGPAVLFRLDPQPAGSLAQDRPSDEYRPACLLLAVAAASVLARTDPTTGWETTVNLTVTGLAAEVRLTVAERTRLGARLRWLLASGVDPARVRRRAESLTRAERDAGGHFLLRLATERASIGPDVVAALAAGYRLLGLPEDQLYPTLYRSLTSDEHCGSHEPVLVRRGLPDTTGHGLPWAPALPAAESTAVPPSATVHPSPKVEAAAQPASTWERPVSGQLPLRPAVIDRRITETEAVGALLAEIFTADDDPSDLPGSTQEGHTPAPLPGSHQYGGTLGTETQAPGGATGLDAAHRTILAAVATRPTWSGAEFAALAAGQRLLPAGALDLINETAIDLTGLPAIEGDDVLEVDAAVVREMLG